MESCDSPPTLAVLGDAEAFHLVAPQALDVGRLMAARKNAGQGDSTTYDLAYRNGSKRTVWGPHAT